MAKKPEIPEGWYCKSEMARILGPTTVRNFDATYRRHAPPDKVMEIDGRLYFHAWSLIRAWAAQKVKAEPSDDPLMATGGDSPALEEYRRARARLAWMDVNQREKTHVPLATLEPALMNLTGLLRRAGDRLARQHGNDAALVLNEAVDQWAESVESLLENESDAPVADADRAEHPHAPAADDA